MTRRSQAVDTGWNDAKHKAKDPALASVRNRQDFKGCWRTWSRRRRVNRSHELTGTAARNDKIFPNFGVVGPVPIGATLKIANN